MEAKVHDRIVLHGRRVGQPQRVGEIVEVRGAHGDPPYIVHWADGHEGLCFPGTDATIEPAPERER